MSIPVLTVEADTLPQAWERAVVLTFEKGIGIRTEYDRKGDPESKDCTMIIVVRHPFREPRIHRAFPGGLADLEVYAQEVIEGIHDCWIDTNAGKWSYTYHKRLTDYEINSQRVDQIDYLVAQLSKCFYSRRAQAITWDVQRDRFAHDPPCLQRLWCRISEEGGELILNMNTHWRSRDAYKAAFMNMFAFTRWQGLIAQEISQRIGREIKVGRYVDISDSFHIYGAYYEEFRGFLSLIRNRRFSERIWTTEFCQPFFDEAKKDIERGVKCISRN